jgi:hypothetical protein
MATLEPDDGELRKMLDGLDFPPMSDEPTGIAALSNGELVTEYNMVNRDILRDQNFYEKVRAGDTEAVALRDRHDALLVQLHERNLR